MQNLPNNASNITQLGFADLLLHAGHYEKSQALISSYLHHNKPNEKVYLLSAALARIDGKLEVAADFYKMVLSENPNNTASHMYLSSLNQKKYFFPDLEKSVVDLPAPFLLYKDFLPHSTTTTLWDFIKNNKTNFIPATINNTQSQNTIDRTLRNNFFLKNFLSEKPLRQIILTEVEKKIPSMWKILPKTTGEYIYTEMKLNVYQHGHYFKIHNDTISSPHKSNKRKISFVYFIPNEPKMYQGGELLLYDTKLNPQEAGAIYTKIIPVSNMLIAFPSTALHEVTRVVEKSSEFKNCRFVINGHIHID